MDRKIGHIDNNNHKKLQQWNMFSGMNSSEVSRQAGLNLTRYKNSPTGDSGISSAISLAISSAVDAAVNSAVDEAVDAAVNSALYHENLEESSRDLREIPVKEQKKDLRSSKVYKYNRIYRGILSL